jgi:tetrahedral aminopeptidase
MTAKNDMILNPQAGKLPSPRIAAPQLRLLERLCNAAGVSGDEGEVRKIVLEEVRPLAAEVKIDAMGSVLAYHPGQGEQRLCLMVAAHMDEVGFMITDDDGDGILRFALVGGPETRFLVGKPVLVGRQRVPGVIGAKPIHLSQPEERRQPLSVESLRIDVSPDNARKVHVGDYAVFATQFQRIGPSLRSKALDDRLGVATLIELLRHAPPNVDLLAAFTVQEEVGLRGAKVAAFALDPQLAIVLDCTPARDLPSWDDGGLYSLDAVEPARYNTRLGLGPAVYVADRGTLYDPRLVRHLISTAEALGIPYQVRQPGEGSTDGATIHRQRSGIPTVAISVPGRYIHTPAAIARLEDWKNSLALLHAAISRLSPDILAVER